MSSHEIHPTSTNYSNHSNDRNPSANATAASLLIPMAQRASAFKGAHQQGASDEAAATSAPHHGAASSRVSIPPRHIPATSMSHMSGGQLSSSGTQASPPLPSFAQLVSVASSAEQAASAIISSAKEAAASKRRKTQDGSFSSGFSATESNNGGSTSGEADDTELERLENDKERKRKLRYVLLLLSFSYFNSSERLQGPFP